MHHHHDELIARAGRVLPPLVTPFTTEGAIDHGALRANVTRLVAEGIRGLVPLGSNSEAVHLSEAEKLAVVAAVRDAAPDAYVLAGTGQESTAETVRLSNLAVRAGADAVLVLTPSFYLRGRRGYREQIRHFRMVADAVDAPVWVYNVAKFTGVHLPTEVVAGILEHPNVAGVKDSSGDVGHLAPLVREEAPGVPFVGTASALLEGRRAGVPGGVMALANAYPRELLQLLELHDRGEDEAASHLQEVLTRINTAVTAEHGVPGLKHVCTLRGYTGGCVRAPLFDVDEPTARALGALVDEVAEELQDVLART